MELYSDRIISTKPSFTREILKVTNQPNVISFAGGLPNPISFPCEALAQSSQRIIEASGDKVFQYSTTEGYLPLREYIADRYATRFGLKFQAEDILITSGSQQGLDLLGKVLLNKGDGVLIEEPGYLGAIQAFSLYEPKFLPVSLEEDGVNLEELEKILCTNNIKIFYTVPNFQNPTGLTYSKEKREAIGKLLEKYQVVLIEDDPYGELIFEGNTLPYIGAEKLEYSVLFGSFSKTVAPGLRIGFLCTKSKTLMHHLNTAKQGTDLHTNVFSQYLIHDYLVHNNYDNHIHKIKALYQEQSSCMGSAIKEYFPSYVSCTTPMGGMFMWATLHNNLAAMDLLEDAKKQKVLFVPGDPFYTNKERVNTLRLNYTNSDSETIKEGIRRLGEILYQHA